MEPAPFSSHQSADSSVIPSSLDFRSPIHNSSPPPHLDCFLSIPCGFWCINQGKPQYKGRGRIDKSGFKCEYCKGTGHLKASCFRLMGYPKWYKGPRFDDKRQKTPGVQFSKANVAHVGENVYQTDLNTDAGSNGSKDMSRMIQEMYNMFTGKLVADSPIESTDMSAFVGLSVNNGTPGAPNPNAAPIEASSAEVSSSVEAEA